MRPSRNARRNLKDQWRMRSDGERAGRWSINQSRTEKRSRRKSERIGTDLTRKNLRGSRKFRQHPPVRKPVYDTDTRTVAQVAQVAQVSIMMTHKQDALTCRIGLVVYSHPGKKIENVRRYRRRRVFTRW
ncbi:uncharacterized protein [Temnothorax nylanderi]|uniref:uncharacterized protein isoform X1 n=1 Tax=Temnothorax nylanderi TaxID=102681 RepID=UPI003A863329